MSNPFSSDDINNAESVLFVDLPTDEAAAKAAGISHEDIAVLRQRLEALKQRSENPAITQQELLEEIAETKTLLQALIEKAQWQGMQGAAELLQKFGMFAVTSETQSIHDLQKKTRQLLQELTSQEVPRLLKP